jgi:hypothetical protein
MAQRLATTLGGEWTVRVWYNTWWCYSVQLSSISVSELTDGYSALVSDEPGKPGTGAGHWSRGNEFINDAWRNAPNLSSPEAAITEAMTIALAKLAQYTEALNESLSQMTLYLVSLCFQITEAGRGS